MSPHPEAVGETASSPKPSAEPYLTAAQRFIAKAVEELFPDKVVPPPKDRNKKIRDWFSARGLTPPSPSNIYVTIRKTSRTK
jgi:hypothetical protein